MELDIAIYDLSTSVVVMRINVFCVVVIDIVIGEHHKGLVVSEDRYGSENTQEVLSQPDQPYPLWHRE
jgi:hypothetical protein